MQEEAKRFEKDSEGGGGGGGGGGTGGGQSEYFMPQCDWLVINQSDHLVAKM